MGARRSILTAAPWGAIAATACTTAPPSGLVGVSRQGDVGFGMGPTVRETYVAKGTVRGANRVSPVAGADVCALRSGHRHARVETDTEGRFVLGGVTNDPSALSDVVYAGNDVVDGTPRQGEVVEHNTVSVKHHEHFSVTLLVRQDGFRTARLTLELPRDVRAAPVDVVLFPSDAPPIADPPTWPRACDEPVAPARREPEPDAG